MQSLLDQEDGGIDPLALASRHKRKMLLAFLAGTALTIAYFSLATREFKSEAKLFVRLGRESVALDPTATNGQFLAVGESRGSEIYAVEELLSSRPLAEKIVDEFGSYRILEKDPDAGPSLGQRLSVLDDYNLNPLRVYNLRDKAIKVFQETLKVSSGNKSNMVSVSYQSESPQLARDVLQSLLPLACEEHLRVHRARGRKNSSSANPSCCGAIWPNWKISSAI